MITTLRAILIGLVLTSCSVAQQTEQSFDEFWLEFRSAVITDNTESIVTMTRFPFEEKGNLDNSQVVFHNRKSFVDNLNYLLEQKVLSLDNASITENSMRQVVKKKIEIMPQDIPAPDFVGIGEFTFTRNEGKWQFTRAYTD